MYVETDVSMFHIPALWQTEDAKNKQLLETGRRSCPRRFFRYELPLQILRYNKFLIKNLIISWYLQWQSIAKESSWAWSPSNSKSCLFFTTPVCHEAGIWNIDISVSTCVEIVLSAVELRNIKVILLY